MIDEIALPTSLQVTAISDCLPALFQAVPDGGRRFWEFFTVNIRNPHTRRAYFKAVETFAAWCADKGLNDLAAVTPMHVAGYVARPRSLEADRQAVPGRHPYALRLAGYRPDHRLQPITFRAWAKA